MNFRYSISAEAAARLLTRVVMIFDQQLLMVKEVSWRLDGERVEILVEVDCPAALAQRMHAKLLHLQDVVEVSLTVNAATPPGESVEAFGPAALL